MAYVELHPERNEILKFIISILNNYKCLFINGGKAYRYNQLKSPYHG